MKKKFKNKITKLKQITKIFFVIALLISSFGLFTNKTLAWSCGETVTGLDSVTYGTVTGEDGRCWLDRNLGATQVATSFDDYQAYGSLFQWGRFSDGHELISHTSATAGTAINGATNTLSTTNTPVDNNFIQTASSPYDWRSPQNSAL
jgi:hypothetical protein